jgi:DNA-binding NarL/FixJ family response regulator
MGEAGVLNQTEVAMLSSSDRPDDIKRALSLGAHAYLSKAPEPMLLREVVATAVRLAVKFAGSSLEFPARQIPPGPAVAMPDRSG